MELSRNYYVDLIFHLFAHMKVNNASDIYDETYIADMKNALVKETVIPETVTAYYCEHFERLAFVNFLPYFMVKNIDEMKYMICNAGIATDEDNNNFVYPFCSVIDDISDSYLKYWDSMRYAQIAAFEELNQCFDKQEGLLQHFFESLKLKTGMTPKVFISESLRSNGRAMQMGEACVVILPAPSEKYSSQDIFMQLVHECIHMLTDPLLESIRMDDGSHDIAEYQVILYELWLFERDNPDLCREYINWISLDILEECDRYLPITQKKILRELFETL